MDEVTILIAELHSAGYSNEKIGYLLSNYGGKRKAEATIRNWAMRKGEPRKSEWDALVRFKNAVFHVAHSQVSAIEVVAVKC